MANHPEQGHDSINVDATTHAPAARRNAGGWNQQSFGDWHETMSTHWFHESHVQLYFAERYKGNAAMFNITAPWIADKEE